jgi:hypothetical protein
MKSEIKIMDKETVIRLANESGIKGPAPARQGFKMYASPQRLEAFAALVAAAEREACAKVCDNRITNEAGMQREDYENRQCAAAIRARGEQ